MCDKQYTKPSDLRRHKGAADVGVRYRVISVMLNHTLTEVTSDNIEHSHMKELDIPVISVMLNHSITEVTSINIKPQHMKEFVMNVAHVIIKQHKNGV